MGSVLFRDVSVVPEELVFKIDYLGGEMSNYSLNFSRSRPAASSAESAEAAAAFAPPRTKGLRSGAASANLTLDLGRERH